MSRRRLGPCMTTLRSQVHRWSAWAAAWVVLGGCGGKGGEPLVISTPVVEDRGVDTGGNGIAGDDSGQTAPEAVPEGDFWYLATVSGGSASRPSESFAGDELQVVSGSARLTEGSSGFLIELRYAGAVQTVPYQADCRIPIEVTGGLPATAADEPDGDGLIGCAAIEVGSTRYAIEPDGLTVIERNDGREISGEFSLIAQAASGAILQAHGRIHAVLCDAFWSGTPCTY